MTVFDLGEGPVDLVVDGQVAATLDPAAGVTRWYVDNSQGGSFEIHQGTPGASTQMARFAGGILFMAPDTYQTVSGSPGEITLPASFGRLRIVSMDGLNTLPVLDSNKHDVITHGSLGVIMPPQTGRQIGRGAGFLIVTNDSSGGSALYHLGPSGGGSMISLLHDPSNQFSVQDAHQGKIVVRWVDSSYGYEIQNRLADAQKIAYAVYGAL